ncbi:MAG: hypothetical protein L0Y72_05570 [Gemmataceae bacterium]|nr:hypothetical protein [Gemmataceae bacterium]
MVQRSIVVALALVLAWGGYALTQQARQTGPDGDAQRIGELIKQLGSANFKERSNAQKDLEAIGAPAMEQLRKATKGDLETSKRAGDLVRKIEERVFTAQMLTPKRVHLKVKDMPVLDAVAELAKNAGYVIQVQGDRAKLADKKVTLDTGDVTFWEALDQLCAKSGLVEMLTPMQMIPPGLVPQPAVDLPVQILPVQPAPAIKLRALPAQKLPVLPVEPPKKDDAKKPEANAEPVPPPVAPGQAQVVERLRALAAAQVQAAAQAQPVQVQFQAQPVQVQVQGQPIQVQFQPVPFPNGRIRPPGFGPGATPNQINLFPGEPKNHPVSYAGAVRIRLISGTKNKTAHVLTLDVAAEPRLQNFMLAGAPTIEKAVDDQDQPLERAADQPQEIPLRGNPVPAPLPAILPPNADIALPFSPFQGNRQVQIRLKAGEKEAKSLKELSGTLTAQVLIPSETLLSVDNVLKSAGQTTKGKNGDAVHVTSIDKMDNGDYKVQLRLENAPGQNAFGALNGAVQIQMQLQVQGNIVIEGAGAPAPFANTPGLPDLVDAKGNKYKIKQIPARRMNFNNGVATQELTIVYGGGEGQGEPVRLLVTGPRMANITIPFAFKNVPLQ